MWISVAWKYWAFNQLKVTPLLKSCKSCRWQYYPSCQRRELDTSWNYNLFNLLCSPCPSTDFVNGSTCVKLNIAHTNDTHDFLQATPALTTYLILYLLKGFLIIHLALMTSRMATAIHLNESSVGPSSIFLSKPWRMQLQWSNSWHVEGHYV